MNLPTDQEIADRVITEDVPDKLLTDVADFGPVIACYTRAQAIADGVLVDVTEWASADKGFHGGFTCPVAVTDSVWADVRNIPRGLAGIADVRGRAHDLLWMASLAARRRHLRGDESEQCRYFEVILPHPDIYRPGVDMAHPKHLRRYKMLAGPGDNGEFVVTIMQTHED